MFTISLASPEAMEQFVVDFAHCLPKHCLLTLSGPLGAGKTTVARGILRGLGYKGRVKSPTFTLVEPYTIGQQFVYHFDLYRLQDPEELDFIGFTDYLQDLDSLCLIEWPEKAEALLPNNTFNKNFQVVDENTRQISYEY